MPQMTYAKLNDLTHEVADALGRATGARPDIEELYRLNDALTVWLLERDWQFVD